MLTTETDPDLGRCKFVAEGLGEVGYLPGDPVAGRRGTWRISPQPLSLPPSDVDWLYALGHHLHAFNRAADELYLASAAGCQPNWIAEYLDQGKPESLVRYGRMRQLRRSCPTVIRPDVIPTPGGMLITELDAVPGGMGLIARTSELYNALGWQLIGDETTLPGAFAEMVRAVAGERSPSLAIVVSEESATYRIEMTWLTRKMAALGIEAFVVAPEDLSYSDDGVVVRGRSGDVQINVVYRFFELFDLPNIASVARLMYLNERNRVMVVPPFRPLFEEKMLMALFHHPLLTTYWQRAIGDEGWAFLHACFPPTWILDPKRIPPHLTVPGANSIGAEMDSWGRLENLGRRHRQFVIKPSGFSEVAWGSRGVVVGHDIATSEWNSELGRALGSFEKTPHVLQEFRAGRQFVGRYHDTASGSVRTIPCRVRLSPYFLVVGDEVRLTSVMATMCPLDKKKIHGMPDAIITPCTIGEPVKEVTP